MMAAIKSGLSVKLVTSLLSKEALGSLKKRQGTKTVFAVNAPGRIWTWLLPKSGDFNRDE